jgi:hypothetical protein
LGKITIAVSILVTLAVTGLYFVSQANPSLFGVQMSLVTLIAFYLVIAFVVIASYDDGK